MRGVWVVLLVVLLVGCKSAPSSRNRGYVDLNLKDMPNVDILATNGEPDSCEFIPLETNEKCLLEWIDEIVVTDSIIVLHGPFAMQLHIFDRRGAYINTIHAGRGPEEPSTLRVWYVDTVKERISNLDLYTGSWMHYTYRGEHIETIPMSDSLYKELKPECIADIKPIDSDHFLAVYSDYPDIEYKYYVLSRKDMSVVDSFVKTRHFEGLEFQASTLSVVGVDEVLTFANKSDTIYAFNEKNEILPKYVVHGDRKPITPEVYDKFLGMAASDRVFGLFEQGYSMGIGIMMATRNHLCFYINGLGQDGYRVIGNTSTNSFTKVLYNNEHEVRSYYTGEFRGATDDGFIGFISPMELLKDKDKPFVQGHPQLREICKTLKEDDNPIIGIYYVK